MFFSPSQTIFVFHSSIFYVLTGLHKLSCLKILPHSRRAFLTSSKGHNCKMQSQDFTRYTVHGTSANRLEYANLALPTAPSFLNSPTFCQQTQSTSGTSGHFTRWARISYGSSQIYKKKGAEPKMDCSCLRSFWKHQKSIPDNFLQRSYTSIFFSTFFFHRKKYILKSRKYFWWNFSKIL